MLKKTFLLMCLSAVAFADGDRKPLMVPPPPPLVVTPVSDEAAEKARLQAEGVSRRYVGIHGALNLGVLTVDSMWNRFYGFLAGNVGIGVLTEGRYVVLSGGFGYSWALSRVGESMWFLDVMGIVPVGWTTDADRDAYANRSSTFGYAGAGVGVGFRYLHRSGFSLGIKVPLGGLVMGGYYGNFSLSDSIGFFYVSSAAGLPLLSFGYRF